MALGVRSQQAQEYLFPAAHNPVPIEGKAMPAGSRAECRAKQWLIE
jgi:hypothetical protein